MTTAFGLNDASRIIAVIDSRIDKTIKSNAKVDMTWGTVQAVSADGKEVSVFLYGESDSAYVSEGFRVPDASYLTVGDSVRVAIDYATDERWVAEYSIATAYKQVAVASDGVIRFGSGAIAPDLSLSRSGVNELQVSGSLRLLATGDAGLASTTHGFQIGPSSAANLIADINEIMARNNGVAASLALNADGGGVSISNNNAPTTATDGLTIGADVNLYRSSANVLKTDDAFSIGSTLLYLGSDSRMEYYATEPAWRLTNAAGSVAMRFRAGGLYVGAAWADPAPAIAGIQFGADVDLYRAGANTLQTNDSLIVVGTIEAGGDGAGNAIDGVALTGGNIEMRNANPFIDFKTTNIDYGARIIYDYNVADGLEFVGATQYKFDNELYNTGIIRSDSYLQANANIYMNSGSIYVGYSGTAWDVNLYRAGADNLKTDDKFTAPNIYSGAITMTPTAGSPTSASETFPGSKSMNGTLYGATTADTTVIGATWHGESITALSATSITMYGFRDNNTSTTMTYVIIGI